MPEEEKTPYYVYMLRCSDDTLYTGIAKDPYQRLEEHNSGKGAKYTRGRGPCELMYLERCPDKGEALSREYRLKQKRREEKLGLIRAYAEQQDAGEEERRPIAGPAAGPAEAEEEA